MIKFFASRCLYPCCLYAAFAVHFGTGLKKQHLLDYEPALEES
jgi:hypothetical protein